VKIKIIHAVVIICAITWIALWGNSLQVNAQQQEELKKYENASLGISFQYPSNWRQDDLPFCVIEGCLNFFTTLPKLDNASNPTLKSNECHWNETDSITASETCDVYSIGVGVYQLNKPDELSSIEEACNCKTLKDFVKWGYNRNYIDVGDTKNTFINDNQTTIGKNYSAWQMESVQSYKPQDGSGSDEKQFTVWTINDNLGYRFLFSGPPDSRFDKFVNVFKNMLKTVTITTPPTPPPEKKPSFLNSSDIANTPFTGDSIPFLNKSNSVTILSHNSYTDDVGYFHVVGEVENNTPTTAEFVQVTGTFYDINNAVVGTQFTYTNPSDISSGAKAPFDLVLTSASVPSSLIDQYKLDVSYQ
jgi:hypothetical protein